ncbi:Spy/CpxP family protein refolding chaperone [Hyphomicrobium sp. D-2]|uniref:Spy/CpxP family protein refolding chaperone n=1 Tax=Hyphomicrobium sp. D-2 TaxID=3041621 RepID=UPI002456222E|nr:Spy/CpxP family protein refolding chaperone [Hyphomicrobium sp. D-2]MDH4983104.1 Spy/CpxP family protein refolding chaperone [Hyphomicrobium sp. D-2]
MVRGSIIALAASISVGALVTATDSQARGFGGGGHFGGFGGGGHFGGRADFGRMGGGFRPEFHPEFRPEMHSAPRMEHRDIDSDHARDDRRDVRDRDQHRADDHRPDHDHHRPDDHAGDHRPADHIGDHRPDDHAADRALDRHDLNRDLAHRDDLNHHWNNWNRPVNWGRWDHNGFWNNHWNARNFNCFNCRWGWAGPVFWPFALGDMWSFAWWPYAATAPFWNYNVDYIMGGLFWPNGAYAWPSGGYGATAWTNTDSSYTYAQSSHQDIYSAGPSNSAAAAPSDASDASGAGSSVAADGGDSNDNSNVAPSQSADLSTCSGFAPGVSGLPIAQIKSSVKPTGAQLADLKALEAASDQAGNVLGNSCPKSPPLTPVGRLDALQKRLDAMVQGIDLVRGPLARFDASLTAEQRQALDALGGDKAASPAALCSNQNEAFVNVPTQEIIATVDPNDAQKAALDKLDAVSAKAAAMLQETCPAQVPATTEARLDAMGKRLKATVTAMNEVRPALSGFYDSLSDEQKARFNTMPGN